MNEKNISYERVSYDIKKIKERINNLSCKLANKESDVKYEKDLFRKNEIYEEIADIEATIEDLEDDLQDLLEK